jgi:hypothetical protein
VIEGSVAVLLFFIVMALAFAGVLYIRAFFTRKAIFRVIEIFYRHHALGITGAKTLHELFERITRPRDYKQYALQILVKRGILIENEDGKVYLAEERLDQDLRNKGNDLFSH